MPLDSVQRGGLVEQVLDQMRELIASGEWPVGERIPPEPALASSMCVGRSTVREAIRALTHTGILTVRQGDGTRVRATSEVSGVVRRQLPAADRRHIIEVRRALDGEAARLAAERRTERDLGRLEQALIERESAWEQRDVDTWVAADAAFHLAVVDAAHNPVLAQLYAGFTDTLHASIATTVRTGLRRENHIEHDGLLAAIRARDGERAAAEARGLLARVSAVSDHQA